ncbi:hypothetical protein E3P77_02787 [Wallemia ichthyophaga]|uniref:Protein YIF1 n=2 Tax=Wallemia ichthyophaga TaxID=245174 RepID=A0A4T0ILM8_WALIC|nr:Protein transport protein yif1 [Wallemia ichthyophaga EXF-994]TIA69843.1 hypothetical protein E3P91_03416 [Wallemia ichthyophaga]EOR03708.1 Protein transport protein yif1 [Wallemia ichthyophaga EXF-994]TIA79343.1 hypothetical protein E3P98_03368 [Wallemia ichthyophaga]TIB05309.1 hypothetical protein E3P96_01207 [Wallemia ichthyophaga]TIB30163.1 hypothetical protein E3P84_03447 [Wallemia ichthyophaga]
MYAAGAAPASGSQVPLQHPVPQHPFKPPPTPDTLAKDKDSRGSLDSNGFAFEQDPYNPYNPSNYVEQQQQQVYPQQQLYPQQHAYPQQQPQYAQQQPYTTYQPMQPHQQSQETPWNNLNDGTTQMGLQFGKSAFMAGHDYVDKNIARHIPLPIVKTLFNVNTTYVISKLRLIYFPWRHKPWLRQRNESIGNDGFSVSAGYLSPRQDINSPDLYIPTMSVLTYIIVAAIYAGIQNKFHPEVLGARASLSFAVAALEFCLIRLICYLLGVETSNSGGSGWSSGVSGSVELFSYCGYKFVSIIPPLFITIFIPRWRLVYYSSFVYCVAAQGFFLLRSLKYVVLPDASSAAATTSISVGSSERRRRLQFLFIVACLQLVWMGILVWI